MRSAIGSRNLPALIPRHDQRGGSAKAREHALPVRFRGFVIELAQPLDVVSIRARPRKLGVFTAREGVVEGKDLAQQQTP